MEWNKESAIDLLASYMLVQRSGGIKDNDIVRAISIDALKDAQNFCKGYLIVAGVVDSLKKKE